MKRTSHSSRTGIKSGQGDRTPRGSRSVFISFLVLGASFLVLAALTIGFYRLYIATGGYSLGLLACLWWLAIAVLMGLLVLFSLRVRTKNALPGPTVGLISALQGDPNPSVRAKAAERLAELDVEEFAHHHKHNKLDNILMSALQGDPDPSVRAKAAEGLAQLDVEESAHYHEHNKLDNILISALQGDPDPGVRAKVAEGLAQLELEEFVHHHKHNKLDNILMSALQGDPDPGVRAKAAEGLAQLELEESSYHPEHNNSWFARFLTIY